MHYTKEDLKEHQELLRQMAEGEQTDPLKFRELNMKLMKQTLDNILHPKEDEEVNPFLCALRDTLADLLFKHENHPHLMFARGQLDSLESMLALDPLQRIPWATRRFVLSHTSAFNVLRALNELPRCGGELAKIISPPLAYNERRAILSAAPIMRQLNKHHLVSRCQRGRFQVYHLSDLGKLVLALIADRRL